MNRRPICTVILGCLLLLGDLFIASACAEDETRALDLVLRKSLHQPPSQSFPATDVVYQVGFAKNGLLACYTSIPGFPHTADLNLWDRETGKLVRQIKRPYGMKGVVLYPGGPITTDYFFTTVPHARLSFRTVDGLDVQDDFTDPKLRRIPLKKLKGEVEIETGGLYYSPSDHYVAAVLSADTWRSRTGAAPNPNLPPKLVNVWDSRTGDRLHQLALPKEHNGGLWSVAFDLADRFVAVAMERRDIPGTRSSVIAWDLKPGKEVLHTNEYFYVRQLAFSTSGELIAAGDALRTPDNHGDKPQAGVIKIMKIDSGVNADANSTQNEDAEEELDPESARVINCPNLIMAMVLVPEFGLVTGDWHGQLMLWDLNTRTLLAVAATKGEHIVSLAVGDDGKSVASGDWNSTAHLWKLHPRDAKQP